MTKLTLLLALAIGVSTPACYLQRDGDALEAQVRALEARQNEFITTFEVERDELTAMLEEAETEIAAMQASLQDAQNLLTRNNAGLGVEVDALTQEISQLRGLLEQATFRADQLQQEIELMRMDFEIQLQALSAPAQ